MGMCYRPVDALGVRKKGTEFFSRTDALIDAALADLCCIHVLDVFVNDCTPRASW